ncbi:MAG: HlyD family efflux transporter periplasmic adaptor subunit [bacterium]|nr:HlyD family efflux transporter periplasmic adaptor subunit [bacterium]
MLQRISLLLAACMLLTPAWGESTSKKPVKKAPPAPKAKTYKVKPAPFRIEIKLPGIFEAEKMTEVSFEAEAATSLTILKTVEHGAMVSKGDTLITPMLEKFDKALKSKQRGDIAGNLSLRQAEAGFAQLKASTPLKLAAAERAITRAKEDFEHFKKTRKLAVKNAKETYQTALDRLAYITEELRQLKKMYEADDLTEETEEIVLRRTTDAVRRTTLAAEEAKVYLDRTLNTNMPRKEKDMTRATQTTITANKNAQIMIPMALEKATLDIEAARRGRKKAKKALADLKTDRGMMTIKAPADGMVYYGKCTQGKWNSAIIAPKFVPKGKLPAKQVLITIIDPKSLFLRVSISEKDIGLLTAGQTGSATAIAYPNDTLAVKLDKFSRAPTASGKFDAQLALPDGAGLASAGMTCNVTLVIRDNPKALTVPTSAVFKDAGRKFVRVIKDGKKTKRPVVTGRTHAGKVEILKGLDAGETVLRKATN